MLSLVAASITSSCDLFQIAVHLPPIVATVIFIAGIAGLFWLDRDPEVQTSKALWIPTAWLLITCSRGVSMWLGMAPTAGPADIYLEGSPIDRAVLICFLAAGLAVLLSRTEQVGQLLGPNWPILLFFSYAALSILWSDFPFITFKHWIKGISQVVMVLIVLTEPNVKEAIKRLVTRVGFLHLPLSILFYKYYPSLGRRLTLSWNEECTGVTTQKNALGNICLIFGLGLLWRFRTEYCERENPRRTQRLLALGTVLAMAVWLLWMCNSLTSICTLAMASAVMLLSTRPAFRGKPARVLALVAALLGITLYALFFQDSRTLVQDLGRAPTLSGRTLIWSMVLDVPVNRLVGAGYETFWLGSRLDQLWSSGQTDLNESHNGYIEIYVNLGWVGVSLLALLIVTGCRNVVAELRRDPDYGGLKMAYVLVALSVGLTEAAFRMMSSPWTFFLLATIAVPEEPALIADDEVAWTVDEKADEALVVGLGGGID